MYRVQWPALTIFAGIFSSEAAGPKPVNDFARVVYETVRFNWP